MKILLDIPEPQLQSVTDLAKSQGVSRSQLIRNAVDSYLLPRTKPMSSYIGLWARAAERSPEGLDQLDALEYQDKLRSEW